MTWRQRTRLAVIGLLVVGAYCAAIYLLGYGVRLAVEHLAGPL